VSQRRLSPLPAFQPGRKCVEASDDVIKVFYMIRSIVSNLFRFNLAAFNSRETNSVLRLKSCLGAPKNFVSNDNRRPRAVIRVYDAAGGVIETHEHAGEFKEALSVVPFHLSEVLGKRSPERHEPKASVILQTNLFQFVFRTRLADRACGGAN